MVIVPASVIITLIDGNVGTIDAEELAERNLLGKLMNQFDEDSFCDSSEISDEP